MAFATKVQPYKVSEYSWTTNTPTDHEIDLDGLVNTISFIDTPTNCSVRLESTGNDEITDIAADDKIDGIPFTKIYITSSDTNESIKFFTAWID